MKRKLESISNSFNGNSIPSFFLHLLFSLSLTLIIGIFYCLLHFAITSFHYKTPCITLFSFIYYFDYLYANYRHLEEERGCKHSFLVLTCVCVYVCVCVCVCIYPLPPGGFFRLHDVCDIHEKFGSTMFCCEY